MLSVKVLSAKEKERLKEELNSKRNMITFFEEIRKSLHLAKSPLQVTEALNRLKQGLEQMSSKDFLSCNARQDIQKIRSVLFQTHMHDRTRFELNDKLLILISKWKEEEQEQTPKISFNP